jgi:hypothetical protein
MDSDSLLYFLAFLPTIGFFIKMGMDAWSGSKQGGDSAVSSIVQYSLMTLYLAAVVAIIGSKIHKGVMMITNDFMWFFGSIVFIFIVYVAIIVLHAVHYPKLQYGRITPGISESVNNLIMIPLWILIFYNMHTLLQCQKNNTCSSPISFYTFAILAFGLMQLYLVIQSFKVLKWWPTDDILMLWMQNRFGVGRAQ